MPVVADQAHLGADVLLVSVGDGEIAFLWRIL
jgi:hypothetical protein